MAKTKLGNYGDNGTPQPQLFAEVFLTGTTIAFTDTPSITDSLSQFRDARFRDAMKIRIGSTSGLNDGDYNIASRGVSPGEILTEESLTTESAAAAGTVTISRLLYQPNITTGCSFCGSLNSK